MQTRLAPVVEVAATLVLDAADAARLRVMLQEAVTNDMDLLEDEQHAGLCTEATIGRITLAIRLDVALS